MALQSAVQKLTIGALRARPLTLPHISLVAAAIAHGIDASERARSAETAYEGLREAVDQSLVALEITLPEFTSAGGRLPSVVLEDWMRAARVLPEVLGRGMEARMRALALALEADVANSDSDGERVLGLLASGALLALMRYPEMLRRME
jgi:hypothetical protein